MKVGEFIYPWGNGHYTRMMRLDKILRSLRDDLEIHYATHSPIYEKLVGEFPDLADRIHCVRMPTPIDGKVGPSISRSVLNVLLPAAGRPPLVSQISRYLKEERKIYDRVGFDLVINDGDMGSNVLAANRGIPSLFVTNQYKPKLWRSRSYFYPSLVFIAKQISKADKILVADSAPPYTMCEYNLNFPEGMLEKVHYTGHFTGRPAAARRVKTDLEKLIEGADFGYWMRTGNMSTNDGTGERYNEVFSKDEMSGERRIVSHARDDPAIERVLDGNKTAYTIRDALEKKIDWIQIDVGFLTEGEKDSVLDGCKYAVVNGSHTVLGEIMGGKRRPIVGMPIYDEHTNQIKWAEERDLGVLARSPSEAIAGIIKIRDDYGRFEEGLGDFADNFEGNGAENAARIAAEMLDGKR